MIQRNIKIDGCFLNINRYYKDTVGYPVELCRYPYDKKWKVIFSKKSWQQDHLHLLITKRINKESDSIHKELEKIKKITNKLIKKDPRLIRRLLPNFIYKIYKQIKFGIFNK